MHQIKMLEDFVLNNSDLLKLESHLCRFNIFDALKIARVEIRHSNFLAWLIDPSESHNQGTQFLTPLLTDWLRRTREKTHQISISPIQLIGSDLRDFEIKREWKNIDLLIKSDSLKLIIAIENKIDSNEHNDQLIRYRKTLETEYPSHQHAFIYMTKNEDAPSDEQWCSYSYRELYQTLQRVRNANENVIGIDVLTFIDHYLDVLKNRLLDHSIVEELCQKIYSCHSEAIQLLTNQQYVNQPIQDLCKKIQKDHQLALELIFDHCGLGSPTAHLIRIISKQLHSTFGDEIFITNQSDFMLECIPQNWQNLFPHIGRDGRVYWCFIKIYLINNQCRTYVYVSPTTDISLRAQTIQRLTLDPNEFGLSTNRTPSDEWTKLTTRRIAGWVSLNATNEEQIAAKVVVDLKQRLKLLTKVPQALNPIFDQYNHQKMQSTSDLRTSPD
tara:strand:+ start:653 stop:1978 length:1326 start_codon:yes stop_codon:yes gene_type:complete